MDDSGYDCHDEPVGGYDDEDGYWLGTAHAWFVLGDEQDDSPTTLPPATPKYYEMSGYLGPDEFTGRFMASSEARVRSFVVGMGCKDVKIMEYEIHGVIPTMIDCVIHVSEEERAVLLGERSSV